MIRKNLIQKGFNTAGTRIMVGGKLPSDFFVNSGHRDNKNTQKSYRSQNFQKYNSISFSKIQDPMLFTFNRSNTEQKIRRNNNSSQTQSFYLKNSVYKRKDQAKLPPVSIYLKSNQIQNNNASLIKDFEIKKQKLKKFRRISNKILHQSMNMHDQILGQIK